MAEIVRGSIASAPSCRFVDVVIPTHGRPKLLRRLLTSLAPQIRSSPECGIIVVNDGTHGPAYSKVIESFDGVAEYIALEYARGPAHARNIGGRKSQAEFVIFTDDDCLPPPHWLDWAIARLGSLPEIDVLGGTTMPPPAGDSPRLIERFNRALHLYPRPLFWRREMYCLPTANVAVRRSVFLKAGGFDELFRFAAGEDTEFFYRLRFSGARFFIDMQWQTEHPISDGLRSFLRRWYRYGYGNAQHRMRTGDPFENGIPPDLTLFEILRELPRYVANRRNYVTGRLQFHDEPLSGQEWEGAFASIASIQRFAYRFGGYRAYRTERLGKLSSSLPTVRPARRSGT